MQLSFTAPARRPRPAACLSCSGLFPQGPLACCFRPEAEPRPGDRSFDPCRTPPCWSWRCPARRQATSLAFCAWSRSSGRLGIPALIPPRLTAPAPGHRGDSITCQGCCARPVGQLGPTCAVGSSQRSACRSAAAGPMRRFSHTTQSHPAARSPAELGGPIFSMRKATPPSPGAARPREQQHPPRPRPPATFCTAQIALAGVAIRVPLKLQRVENWRCTTPWKRRGIGSACGPEADLRLPRLPAICQPWTGSSSSALPWPGSAGVGVLEARPGLTTLQAGGAPRLPPNVGLSDERGKQSDAELVSPVLST